MTTVDTKELRKLYRAELEETLATVGGKSRKRTFRRMVRAVSEHRGGELNDPDETVQVWSDLQARTCKRDRVPGTTVPRRGRHG